jgi:hypothetical protein
MSNKGKLLKDMGVLLGHRRVVLAAIGEPGSPAAALPAREATGEPKSQDTAERRQVTVNPSFVNQKAIH